VQVLLPTTCAPNACFVPDLRVTRPNRLSAALLAIVFLSLRALVSPVVTVAEDKARSVTADKTQPISTELGRSEMALLLAIALFFAMLSMLKDFRSYRGLLHTLVWNFYSWVFLGFTATIIFGVDYAVLPLLHKIIQREAMLHVYLALGHTSVSAAFAYASPFLLGVIPTDGRMTLVGRLHEKSEKEKPATDMNVISMAIRESLENRVNAAMFEWTRKYSWPVIRSTGSMLLTDLVYSGTMASEDCEHVTRELNACREVTGPIC
jgi:hypothetical protein